MVASLKTLAFMALPTHQIKEVTHCIGKLPKERMAALDDEESKSKSSVNEHENESGEFHLHIRMFHLSHTYMQKGSSHEFETSKEKSELRMLGKWMGNELEYQTTSAQIVSPTGKISKIL